MELTPQSTHSPPSSPYLYISNTQSVCDYPSPAQSDSQYRSVESIYELGLYSCSMSGPTTQNSGTVPHHQSSTATDWSTTTLQHRSTPRSSHSTPNILSAEYDPFAPFLPAVSSSYSHDIYSTQPAEVSILPTSPILSSTTSQRSSFSSATASEVFTQPGSIHSHTTRIKMEDFTEYAPGSESMMYGSPPPTHNLIVTAANSYAGSLETTFYHEQPALSWPKVQYANTAPELPSSYSNDQVCERRSISQDRASAEEKRRELNSVARTRQPRKLTTKEDANFQCQVKGCGKLFGRSYNYKAHMETHDAGREYPFPCPLKDCNKKFVRKTDLQRHHQSVHMKQRNHRCGYCSRFFARKDTLRRHMEDGCSKRFDIETVDFRPQSYSISEQAAVKVSSRPLGKPPRQPSYCSSSTRYSPPPGSSSGQDLHSASLISTSRPYYENISRPVYVTGDSSSDVAWSG